MNCLAYSDNDFYKYRLAKTRQNVLKNIYKRCEEVTLANPQPKKKENSRLRLRFKEALHEAQKVCFEEGKDSNECHIAWYEVDELEDAMHRFYSNQ
jgi:hypothetical protein